MAEAKNAFIKSKMNKDLDARLLPSGEYRDAMNIAISRSEGPDVGAVENVKGNELLVDIGASEDPAITGLDIIGFFMDETNNRIFIFSTDSSVQPNEKVADDANCFIHVYDLNSSGDQALTKMVEGSFLNFTKNNFITGVNLLEDLLFFTDNRNQPRVINVTTAIANTSYYQTEDHISVAKLSPYLSINLLNKNEETVSAATTDSTTFILSGTPTYTPTVGDLVSQGTSSKGQVVSYASGTNTVTLDRNASMSADTVVFQKSTMKNRTQEHLDSSFGVEGTVDNPNYDATWEGDTDFLEDKFIRFSYRYKFDDNEYSLLAPFTSPIFIPKQFSYFVDSDEERSYKTSIADFMENLVQEVDLKIPFPSRNPLTDYKIKEVDIIYKESDALSLKVLTTLEVDQIVSDDYSEDENYFTYSYQSKKPYRTLPDDVIVRVFDKVPIKAQAQEVISNRVVYANFQDKNNGPSSIDYRAEAQEKDYARFELTGQYPYHTVKQNRTYQVGVVLSDRYGRTTPVILSTKDINSDTLGRGSTFFHEYSSESSNDPLEHPFGDAIRIIFDNVIPESSSNNYPGAYADSTGKSFDLDSTVSISTTTYTIDQDLTSKLSVNDYFKGKNVDYTKITSITYSSPTTTIVTEDQIADYYGDTTSTDTVFGYSLNTLGWYSYKIVVKQTEQDYYNVYLPTTVNGEFKSSANTDQQAEAVLINDNINKIPRDLSEVGPDQKKFRSSVQLFGRVTQTREDNSAPYSNLQWYPATSSDQVVLIGTKDDLGIGNEDDIYDVEKNPLISIIATKTQSEDTSAYGGATTAQTFGRLPANAANHNLTVYETTPTSTLLEIFYETATTGLISELNREIANTSTSVANDVVDYTFTFNESDEASSGTPFDVTGDFQFIDSAGNRLDETDIPNTPTVINVTNDNGVTISPSPFQVADGSTNGTFKLQAIEEYVYVDGSETALNFNITMRVVANDVVTNVIVEGAVDNAQPTATADTYSQTDAHVNDTTFIELQNNTITGLPSGQLVANGSTITGSDLLGLTYSITSQQRTEPTPITNVDKFQISSSGVVTKKSSATFDIGDEYSVGIDIKDAGGNNVNTQTKSITFNIDFANADLNWGATNTTATGVGCSGASSSSQRVTRNFIFGTNNGSATTGYPPGLYTANGITASLEESALTAGEVTFQLINAQATTCASNFTTYRVWVQYRSTSTSSWVNATLSSGTLPSYPITIDLGVDLNATEDIGSYDNVGEYRVLLEPDTTSGDGSVCDGDGTCNVNDPLTKLKYIDANA